jgi:MFS family permease
MKDDLPVRCLIGFVAGALGVLIFHQGVVELLWLAGLSGRPPYNLAPVPPLGVPAVLSAAFWGGLWGVLLVALLGRRHGPTSWLIGLLFGAVLPTAVAFLVVGPLKGSPLSLARLPFGLAVNGAWGLGTALLADLRPRAARPG